MLEMTGKSREEDRQELRLCQLPRQGDRRDPRHGRAEYIPHETPGRAGVDLIIGSVPTAS